MCAELLANDTIHMKSDVSVVVLRNLHHHHQVCTVKAGFWNFLHCDSGIAERSGEGTAGGRVWRVGKWISEMRQKMTSCNQNVCTDWAWEKKWEIQFEQLHIVRVKYFKYCI
jgi:hypothetical protein